MENQRRGYKSTGKVEKMKDLRRFLLRQVQGLIPEQLNTIPQGYNNNIIWNLTHLICAQQGICYVRAGLPITDSDDYFSPFLPGTKPERFVDGTEIDAIKRLLISTLDQLQVDVDQDVFNNYSPSAMTSKVYGIEVNNINEAFDFLLYHEGFHSGCIFAQKHAVETISFSLNQRKIE